MDTGADVTVITEDTFKGLDIKYRTQSKNFKGANGKVMKVLGEVDICLSSRRGVNIETKAFVLCGASSNLLGKREIESLGLISIINAVSIDGTIAKYGDMFSGLGTLPEVFKIDMKEGVQLYNISTPRRVPIGLRDQVEKELKRMQLLGVISPVEKSTTWCAGMVVAPKKNGKVRICVDLSQLNKGVQRETYPLPRVDDALA